MILVKAALHLIAKPETIAFMKKLGSVWIVSFFAASGGIWARRWHQEKNEPRPDYRERRSAWNGPTRRGRQ